MATITESSTEKNARTERGKHPGFNPSGAKLQPKTPEGAPDSLYYLADNSMNYNPRLDKNLPEIIQSCIKAINGYCGYLLAETEGKEGEFSKEQLDWAEDHFHIYTDGQVATAIPPLHCMLTSEIINQARDERKIPWRETLGMSFAGNVGVHKEGTRKMMKSYLDGGNMLPAENRLIIGLDSLAVTKGLNGEIKEEDAIKAMIAGETGYDVKELVFVEQPYYHLDLAIMYLGKNKVLMKEKNHDVPLTPIAEALKAGGFDVIVDKNGIAGRELIADEESEKKTTSALSEIPWEYNFFNGEYLNCEGKLYYLTNGVSEDNPKREDIMNNFRKMLAEYNGAEVIFSASYTEKELNRYKGGIGCIFKGGPRAAGTHLGVEI